MRRDHPSPRDRAQCPCRDIWRFGQHTRKAVAVGAQAAPIAALDIEIRAGGDELLDHERVAVRRGPNERSGPAETSRELSVDSAKPVRLGTRALPVVVLDIKGGAGGDELLDHERVALQRGQEERRAPAETSQLSDQVEQRAADAGATSALPRVVLDVEFGAGGDELLNHERVALRRGPDERSVPAERSRQLPG